MNALHPSGRNELASALWAMRREFAVCMAFTLVINVLMLTPTLYMLQVFDRVMISQSELTLLAVTAVMLYFLALMAFAEWSRARLLVRVGVRLDAGLNPRVFKAGYLSALGQGGNRAAEALADLTSIRQFMTGNGLFAFMDAPWTPIYIAVLFMLHPWLGALAVVFSVLLAVLAWLSHRLSHAPIEAAMQAGTQAGDDMQGVLRNADVIEAMGMLGNLRRLWLVRHRNYLTLNWRAADIGARMKALTKFLRYTQQSLALGAGALLVIEGQLSPGEMIATNLLISRATQPLDLMVASWKPFLGVCSAYRRLAALLGRYPAHVPAAVAEPLRGHLVVSELTASAPGRERPVLGGISADFPAGLVTGITGPSGSGKSTLARALIGIWPGTEGRVMLDGAAIESFDRDWLGPHIGYLPQDIELFEGSIAENVARFGAVDPDKVIRACQRTGVHDMILRLPKGYDTQVGDAGAFLSGGQRQRIGLARALYGDPVLVVLDEPNSNLDDTGDAALMRAVQDMKDAGCTVFVVSHRSGILGIADRMLVLNDGRIQHYGVRDELMSALRCQPLPEQATVQHS
ncbi:MAG TPA: type I secretion system permease/ATPase [Methyloversatilis sp.]